MIGFGEAIGLFYKNYANFEGRASRAEYWWPTLMQLIVYTALLIGFFLTIGVTEFQADRDLDGATIAIIGTGVLFALVNFLPGLAVKVRRFHDLDQTGWLVLVFWIVNIFIPVADFARLIWFALPGTQGSNQYGSDPYGYDGDIFG